ncbi:acetyltransferase [Membranihabitans maritimus]|uniref:acetyltransferase n=1 Tax=Membranihabitans maritimus TaxID=2904244 RepID=UPI001F01A028|nr:acetyltransferase [Membranihabitans maritimus]
MEHNIGKASKNEYPEIIRIWEKSVRATHHFLKEEDIEYYKPLILDKYLDIVELSVLRTENDEIVGFLGTTGKNIEMLFIHPDYFGIGLGRLLVEFAIEKLGTNTVDVNEQNERAVGFYKHCGFTVTERSELDATGKPYPILHMKLK